MFTNFTILFLEPYNEYSKNAIIVKVQKCCIVGHVPEALAEKLFPLMKEWKLYKVTATMRKKKSARGNFGPWGGIELPCTYTYYLYGPKIHKCNVKNSLKKWKMFFLQRSVNLFHV